LWARQGHFRPLWALAATGGGVECSSAHIVEQVVVGTRHRVLLDPLELLVRGRVRVKIRVRVRVKIRVRVKDQG
tara:strand:+ start:99 stop:320 length:222 start_codon:yes stop_codon:yes gene_type:complete